MHLKKKIQPGIFNKCYKTVNKRGAYQMHKQFTKPSHTQAANVVDQ